VDEFDFSSSDGESDSSSSSLSVAAPPRGARQTRSVPWGPWTIAPVHSNGSQIGWGAQCGFHTNEHEPNVECKRQLTYGKSSPLSDAECRCRVKQWLLDGWGIPQGDFARKAHMKPALRSYPPAVESDLDKQAAAILASMG
jgi:hypothetical protein